MSDQGSAARKAAVALLDQVLGEGRLLSEALGTGTLDTLAPPDRARAQRLATETLRGLERADRILQRHLRKAPPLFVRNVLRLGTVELCQGEAAHGVVHVLVGIVGRHRRHGALKGLVNAVLRKVAANGPDIWETLRVPRLPKWLRTPLIDAWGAETVIAMEAAHFAGAPLDLTLKVPDPDLITALGADLLPTGTVRLRETGQVSALPGFANGAWWVQDAAAALPVLGLRPKPGEKVVDLCAAPGGKTMQLAAAGADVLAVDTSDARLQRLRDNLARTGLTADIRVGDALEVEGQFDAVLLDAPCSATGTIRRHPDLPFAKDGSEFLGLFDLQKQLIDHAWTLVAPGGRLVYCTCSLLPDEGEVQMAEALTRLPDAQIDARPWTDLGLPETWITAELGMRLRPDYWAELGGLDGFYMACLRKPA